MTAPASAAQLLVGAVLNGRYRLVRLLGEGGMGAVYEAEGLRGEGRRAVKMLHQEFVKEEQILQRFYAEAQATRALVHPNVAQVEGSGTAEDGTPYLVMELLQGESVGEYLEKNKVVQPHIAAPMVYAVLQALSAAHALRIIHRDLKPDNLYLVADGRGGTTVKVLDFGIAKVMDAAGGMGSKTKTGMLLGTPGYMSPEQIKNSKGVDPRSDLWSMGIIFFEMLTGRMAFEADNEFARLTAVLTEPVRPIEQVAPHLIAWSGFFQRALAKDPAQRFQSAEEMAHALAATARAAQQPQTGGSARPPAMPQGPAGTSSPTMASSHNTPGYAQAPATLATSPSAPLIAIPGHASAAGQRPASPTVSSGSTTPHVAVIDAPPLAHGAPVWVVAVVGFVGLGIGFVAGFLVGG